MQTSNEPLPPLETDPGRIGELADEILARGEYAPPPTPWYQSVLRWIGDRIGDLLAPLGNRRFDGGGGAGFDVANIVLLIILVPVIALALWLLVRAFRSRPTGRIAKTSQVEIAVTAEPTTAEAWAALAEDFEDSDDWLNALHCRYRVVLARLIERDVLVEQPGRTSGEYRLDMREAEPAVAPQFESVTSIFEDSWYGGFPVGPDETRTVADVGEELLAKVGR